MYHYFEGRDDLIRAVVDATVDSVLGGYAGAVSEPRFLRWVRPVVHTRRTCVYRGWRRGWMPDRFTRRPDRRAGLDSTACAHGAFDRWLAPLVVGLSQLRENGDLRADVDVEELADYVMATLQGGLLLAQVFREPTRLRHALDGARFTLLAAHA